MPNLSFNVYDKEGRWVDSVPDYKRHRISGLRNHSLDPQIYEVDCTSGLTFRVEAPWNGWAAVEKNGG